MALVETEEPFNISTGTREPIISLVCAETRPNIKTVTVAGWGDTVGIDKAPDFQGSEVLKKVEQTVKSQEFCSQAARYMGEEFKNKNQFCAYAENKDSCVGDSGGPALSTDEETGEYKIFGLVSFGPDICATANTPGFYAKLSAFHDWISKTLDRAIADPKWAGDASHPVQGGVRTSEASSLRLSPSGFLISIMLLIVYYPIN